MVTQFKMKMVPFLRTLDADFFIRLVLFSGFVYYCYTYTKHQLATKNVIIVKQGKRDSGSFFSKTFSKEDDFNEALLGKDVGKNILTKESGGSVSQNDDVEELSDEELARRLRPDNLSSSISKETNHQ